MKRPYSLAVTAFILPLIISPFHAHAQAGSFDGNYAGTTTLVYDPNSVKGCDSAPHQRNLTITNGAFSWMFNPTRNEVIPGRVSTDGTVSGFVASSYGGVTISGQIQGGTFTGKVGTAGCTYAIQERKQ